MSNVLPLEEQVCSLEQSKKLAELGVKIGTLFKWMTIVNNEQEQVYLWPGTETMINGYIGEVFHAYTVSELGRLLGKYQIGFVHDEKAFMMVDDEENVPNWEGNFDKKDENLARASALIYLIEEGFLKAEELSL